jgi:hypothetical protein
VILHQVIEEYFSEDGRFHGWFTLFLKNEKKLKGKNWTKGNRISTTAQLVRIHAPLLVKRFESSFGSFAKSIANFEKSTNGYWNSSKLGGKYI